jgi:hypothetical protein
MEIRSEREQNQGKLSTISLFFKKLGNKITGLFEPEEVEVTFKVEGKKVSYTYTKVPHKQVA